MMNSHKIPALHFPLCFIRCFNCFTPFSTLCLRSAEHQEICFPFYNSWWWILTGVILAPVFSFGKSPCEGARRSWWHCSAQRLLQQGKSVIRLQQALDQGCSKETVSMCCYFLKISLAWSRDHIQRALISPSGLLVGPSPRALWLQRIPRPVHGLDNPFYLF